MVPLTVHFEAQHFEVHDFEFFWAGGLCRVLIALAAPMVPFRLRAGVFARLAPFLLTTPDVVDFGSVYYCCIKRISRAQLILCSIFVPCHAQVVTGPCLFLSVDPTDHLNQHG